MIRKAFAALAKSALLAFRVAPFACLALLICKAVAAALPALQIDLTKELTNGVAALLSREGGIRDTAAVLAVLMIIGFCAVVMDLLS